MFINKDLRKIPDIIADALSKDKENGFNPVDNHGGLEEDPSSHTRTETKSSPAAALRDLRLARRKAEFAGAIKILCQPAAYAPVLQNLQSLSLYECEISNLDGIGVLTSLECLSLGRNPLSELPSELGQLVHLQELWLDDCQLQGTLPEPILKLKNLQQLRLTNNQITEIPERISDLTQLQVLALDRNRLTEVPSSLQYMIHLKTLLLRHNCLTALPEGVPGPLMTSLTLFHASSNQLATLPLSLAECPQLTHLYLNGNQITTLPDNLDLLASTLQYATFAHNLITEWPQNWVWGTPDQDGTCGQTKQDGTTMTTTTTTETVVQMRDNPVWKQTTQSPPKLKSRSLAP